MVEGGELDIDDPKFPGAARNSCNHYTMSPLVSNSIVLPQISIVKKASSCRCNENTIKNEENSRTDLNGKTELLKLEFNNPL